MGNREAQIAQLQQQLQEVSAKHAQAERDLRDGNKAMADIFVPLYQKQIAELSEQIMALGGSLTAPVEKAVEVAAPQPPVESAPKQPKLSASELARQQFALHEAEGRAQREALLQKMKQRGAQ